ncbi:hypothetical protein LTR62_007870 [Meristemomyces frigidus]|uniref:tRNA-splicing endonuclease subunit Sen15 domain-containing protein n=1 Tax=Meristemomyces frigidus TaxID=1508187 RepID=A0AAN7TIG3_9PEZI|nr:hypothetical protein LTR62_007870 [Meristemomyces frigidus]
MSSDRHSRFTATSANGRSAESMSPFDPTAVSSLQQFIHANEHRRAPNRPDDTHHLALQVAHSLRFQHNWMDVRLHYQTNRENNGAPGPPRPVISGLPPQRLYVHPDEQIDLLQKQRREGKAGWPEVASEREWVLPTQLGETWSLRRFGEVFDALSTIPPEKQGGPLNFDVVRSSAAGGLQENDDTKSRVPTPGGGPTDGEDAVGRMPDASSGSDAEISGTATETGAPNPSTAPPNPWRTSQPKRMLLASADDDSTIVYYIIHDGLVKPRQN